MFFVYKCDDNSIHLRFILFKKMKPQLIVITGGPGTGKTTIIEHMVADEHCCYPEISRQITLEARKQGIEQLFLEQPLLFSELLLEGRKKQYFSAQEEIQTPIFLDRGIPDILAYMHYIGDSYPAFFEEACAGHRYDKVFILPPWEAIYVSDEARYENFEQAQLIYRHLQETYRHFGYSPIEVPLGPVADRVAFILNEL